MVCFEEVVDGDYILKAKSVIFTIGLCVGCEKKRAVKENSMCFSSSNGIIESITVTGKTRGRTVWRGSRDGNQEFSLRCVLDIQVEMSRSTWISMSEVDKYIRRGWD